MAAAAGSIGLGASLAGGILSAFGASSEGKATRQMYDYQAQISALNSQIDKSNADWARNKGEIEAGQYGMKAAQQFGKIRAAQGASGIDVNSGSAADVQRSQQEITKMDLGQIRSNAAKVAYDYDVKSAMDLNQASLYTMAGKNAEKAGEIKAIGSIIGTAGSVSSKWLQGNQMGMWSTA